MNRRIYPWVRESRSSKICVFIILAFLVMLVTGCVSLEELEKSALPPAATPTSGQMESRVQEIPESVVTRDISTTVQPHSGGYVKKPYGYVYFEESITPSVSVVETKVETDVSGQKFITGRIRNTGTGKIDHLTIVFNLYDANGDMLGNTYASIDNLEAGKTWRFRTESFESQNFQYSELSEIFAV